MAGARLFLPDEQTQALIEFFLRNKYPIIALRGGVESDAWARAVGRAFDDCESQRAEFALVRNAWARAGIECMAIRSDGLYPPFPYTSDNVDILLRHEDWPAAIFVLDQLGYVWLTNTNEANKVLFRKYRAGRTASGIRLHGWVGWETAFHENDELWARARAAADDALLTVPSPEDVILINAAHAFRGADRFTLFDLERTRRHWLRPGIDWDYIEDTAHRHGWADALFFVLAACVHIERAYFSRTSAPERLVKRWEAQVARRPSVRGRYQRLLQREVTLPYELPQEARA